MHIIYFMVGLAVVLLGVAFSAVIVTTMIDRKNQVWLELIRKQHQK